MEGCALVVVGIVLPVDCLEFLAEPGRVVRQPLPAGLKIKSPMTGLNSQSQRTSVTRNLG